MLTCLLVRIGDGPFAMLFSLSVDDCDSLMLVGLGCLFCGVRPWREVAVWLSWHLGVYRWIFLLGGLAYLRRTGVQKRIGWQF
jgi:hypothetical protein